MANLFYLYFFILKEKQMKNHNWLMIFLEDRNLLVVLGTRSKLTDLTWLVILLLKWKRNGVSIFVIYPKGLNFGPCQKCL